MQKMSKPRDEAAALCPQDRERDTAGLLRPRCAPATPSQRGFSCLGAHTAWLGHRALLRQAQQPPGTCAKGAKPGQMERHRAGREQRPVFTPGPSAGISQQTEGWKAWADEQSGLLNWAQTLITSTLRPSTAEGNAKAKGCVLGQPGRALHQSPQLPCLLHQTPPFSPQFLAAAGLEGQSPRLRQSQAHVASPSPGGLCCGPRDTSPAQGRHSWAQCVPEVAVTTLCVPG